MALYLTFFLKNFKKSSHVKVHFHVPLYVRYSLLTNCKFSRKLFPKQWSQAWILKKGLLNKCTYFIWYDVFDLNMKQ